MTESIKTKWIKALRSGKYTQGQGSLKSSDDPKTATFCCLGVLADIQGCNWYGSDLAITFDYDGNEYHANREVSCLPEGFLSPHYETCEFLANKNDGTITSDGSVDEWDFETISNWIEENLDDDLCRKE